MWLSAEDYQYDCYHERPLTILSFSLITMDAPSIHEIHNLHSMPSQGDHNRSGTCRPTQNIFSRYANRYTHYVLWKWRLPVLTLLHLGQRCIAFASRFDSIKATLRSATSPTTLSPCEAQWLVMEQLVTTLSPGIKSSLQPALLHV